LIGARRINATSHKFAWYANSNLSKGRLRRRQTSSLPAGCRD
jgi:hypothetical protein